MSFFVYIMRIRDDRLYVMAHELTLDAPSISNMPFRLTQQLRLLNAPLEAR
jgi:hypothetical protein